MQEGGNEEKEKQGEEEEERPQQGQEEEAGGCVVPDLPLPFAMLTGGSVVRTRPPSSAQPLSTSLPEQPQQQQQQQQQQQKEKEKEEKEEHLSPEQRSWRRRRQWQRFLRLHQQYVQLEWELPPLPQSLREPIAALLARSSAETPQHMADLRLLVRLAAVRVRLRLQAHPGCPGVVLTVPVCVVSTSCARSL